VGASAVPITEPAWSYGGITNYTQSNIYAGRSFTLTAPASAGGNLFSGWTGCALPSGYDCIEALSSDKTITANYLPPYTLTTSVSPIGSGIISGVGISCPGDCDETYPSGTWVTLIATEVASYSFESWSGDCGGQTSSCSIQINGDTIATANFTDAIIPGACGPAAGTSIPSQPTGSEACGEGVFSDDPDDPGMWNWKCLGLNGGSPAICSAIDSNGGGPLTVACVADPKVVLLGENVTWTATVTGGTEPFIYSWSGPGFPTPAPTSNPFTLSYSTIGKKVATVTVFDSEALQATCETGTVDGTVQVNFDPTFKEF